MKVVISLGCAAALGCSGVFCNAEEAKCESVKVAHWKDKKDGLYKVSYRCDSVGSSKHKLVLSSKTRIGLPSDATETEKK